MANTRQRLNQAAFDETADRRDSNTEVIRHFAKLKRPALIKRDRVYSAIPLRRVFSLLFGFANSCRVHTRPTDSPTQPLNTSPIFFALGGALRPFRNSGTPCRAARLCGGQGRAHGVCHEASCPSRAGLLPAALKTLDRTAR